MVDFIFVGASSAPGGNGRVLRVVSVATRGAAETILSRLRKDSPLALGARGMAEVRTLSPERANRLPPLVKAAVADLPLGGHIRVITDSRGDSICRVCTFDFYRKASELYGRGLKAQALQKIETDLVLNPDPIKGLALIGRIYEDGREYRKAAEGYQQRIGFHPDYVEIRLRPHSGGRKRSDPTVTKNLPRRS